MNIRLKKSGEYKNMHKIDAINILVNPKSEIPKEQLTETIELIYKELQKIGKLEITLLYK